MTEIDFPRGGRTPQPTGPTKRLKKQNLFGVKEKPVVEKTINKKQKEKQTKEEDGYEGVFLQNLTIDLLTPGVRGLGFVTKINETDVVLECCDGILVKLPALSVSKSFTSRLQTTDKTLDDIFTIGQAIAFKVTKGSAIQANKKRTRVEVTTCPYMVNSHFVVLNLQEGLAVNGIISSIEEKGAIIDFGISSKITGFVKTDDLPDYLSLDKLCIGQVILVRIKATPTALTRVINVTAFTEMETLNDENLSSNILMPGTILLAQPEKMTKSGVFISFQNDVKGFVRSLYLPPRLRADPDKFTKSIRTCVLACQQNSPLLVLSAHPDILAISKAERRALPDKYKIGKKVNCVVYDIDKHQNICFWLEEDKDGKVPLLAAKALRNQIDDESLAKFSIGSTHLCRIIGYHSVERVVMVSTNSKVMKQKIISSVDIFPGDKLTVTITSVTPHGLKVSLCDGVDGIVGLLHVKNRPSAVWQKAFRKGQQIQCRVLLADPEANKFYLTAKSAMVESKEKIVTEITENLVGETAVGTIIKILDTGAFIVGFYNRVVGLVDARIAKKITNAFLGMPIKTRIIKLNMESNQLFLDFGDESLDNVVTNQTKLDKDSVKESKKEQRLSQIKPAKPFHIYTAKVVGAWIYGGTSSDTSAELLLNGGTIGRLHASELDLSNYETGSKPMEAFLAINIGKTVNVKVICVGNPRYTSSEGKKQLRKQFQTSRFVECTVNPTKISETKRKLKLINFKSEFQYGSIIEAFYTPVTETKAEKIPSGGFCSGEVNPLFKMIISRKEVSKLELEAGALIKGKVIGVNKTNRSKCIVLAIEENDDDVDIEREVKLLRKKSENRKRKLSASQTTKEEPMDSESAKLLDSLVSKKKELKRAKVEPTKQLVAEVKPKFVKIDDPGFDWSLSGFTVENLVNVGKRDYDSSTNASKTKKSKASKENNYISVLESLNDDNIEMDEADCNRLIANNPNSVEPWIKCVAYFMAQKNYDEAKSIIEQSLKTISFQKDTDLFSIWNVYLNLEVTLGTEESLRAVFERACAATNSLQMHKHFIKLLKKFSKDEEVNDVFESMLRKFRHDDLEVWYLYGEHLLSLGEVEKIRQLLDRALQSLEKKHHFSVLCRFAQLEYKHGDAQRGRTMFEKIVHSCGKKLLIWNLFADMALKYEGILEARKVFEHAIRVNENSPEKLSLLLKKWQEAEEKFGDLESQLILKKKCEEILNTQNLQQ